MIGKYIYTAQTKYLEFGLSSVLVLGYVKKININL